MPVDRERIRPLNAAAVREDADYVLYWSQANRRAGSNEALAHAAALANTSGLPLLVYEGLTCTHPHANDRFHTFILEGVPDNARDLAKMRAGYFFYYRARRNEPNDLLYRLAARARTVVTDDYPTFLAARFNATVPAKLGVECLAVDASCVVPMSLRDKREYGAYTIRPRIQRELPRFFRPLEPVRLKKPWHEGLLPKEVAKLRTVVTGSSIPGLVRGAEISHAVPPSVSFRGGPEAARQRLERFLEQRLRRYAREASQPSCRATSELSPYLHFGQLSALEVALAVRDYADAHSLMAGEFLEQLIVRRELAFNFARFTADPQSLAALPDWCHRTLAKHASDSRPYLYSPEQFECAKTHDSLWNAAQRELLICGTIHGYYRMYWGKKIIEWSSSHDEALRVMIHLHDVYALDGRDPNTYTNILWCFGLHDRPWSERPVFGQIRYMSLEGMRRKTDVDAYIRQIDRIERDGGEPGSEQGSLL